MGKKGCSKQQCMKHYEKECFFCGENDYSLLDVHRIFEGARGGTYDERNCLVVCCKCHRKIHSGRIVIRGKYPSTGRKLWTIHYTEDNIEHWR